MKILVIHTSYRISGGEDSVVSNEIKLLRSMGIEVELLKFSNDKGTVLKVLQMPFNLSAYLITRKQIASFKPDIVHIHNLHFGASPSVIYAIKRHNIPIVITLHNYRLLCPSATLFNDGEIFTDSVNKLFPLKAIVKKAYLHSIPLTFYSSLSMIFHQLIGTWNITSRYIALGEHSKQLFVNSKLHINSDSIVVKPNFCYSKPYQELEEGSYYVYLGRLSEEKGLDVLIKAFAKNKLPLKIVGTGPMQSKIQYYSERYYNINYIGGLAKEQVHTLLKNASALIFPSLWYETFGMVIIEAFATGTPVIASELGQMKNLITNEHNGLHFKHGSVKDLNEKLTFFENLPKLAKAHYRKNARKTYEDKYTPDKNAQQLISIYHSVLNEMRETERIVWG